MTAEASHRHHHKPSEMTDNPDQYDQEAAATLLAMEAAATLLAMQAEGSPAVNIRRFPILPEAPEPGRFPILPEAPEPDNLPRVRRSPRLTPRAPDNLSSVRRSTRLAGRAAVNESRRVPYNLEELTWGARRRRTQRQ
ncbi:hypothetical protein SLA2020_020680 [Shorea laevis]